MLTLRYNEPVFILTLRGRVGCLRQPTLPLRVWWRCSEEGNMRKWCLLLGEGRNKVLDEEQEAREDQVASAKHCAK